MDRDSEKVAVHDTGFLPPPAPAGNPVPRLRSWAKPVAGLLAGAAFGVLAAMAMSRAEAWLPAISPVLVLVFGALMAWPHIVLHEAGHAVAGLARGMRAIAFGIGPWRWERSLSGWRFRRARGIAGISGFAALLPVGGHGLSRFDQGVFLLGGPMANLLTGLLATALLVPFAGTRVVASFLLGSAASALLIGVANLVPFHSQGWRSDGRGLLDLWRDTPEAMLLQQAHRLLALTMAGIRPRDWPRELVPGPVVAASSPLLAVNGDLMRLSWAMDSGDRAASTAAARHIAAALHTVPKAFQAHLAIAMAGFAARQLRDREVLAAWRALCEGGLTDLSLFRDWLDAEHAALSGDVTGASKASAAVRGRLDDAPDPVSATLLREYLDELDANLQRPSPAV